jgi:hypothetical protein
MHFSRLEARPMQWRVWVQSGGEKEALIVHARSGHVGVVYDRVDDPDGPSAQYGIQWLPWEEFWRTHDLKEWSGWLT